MLRRVLVFLEQRTGWLAEDNAVERDRDVVVGMDVDCQSGSPAPSRQLKEPAVQRRGWARLVGADCDPFRARDRVRPGDARDGIQRPRSSALRHDERLLPGYPVVDGERVERVATRRRPVAASERERLWSAVAVVCLVSGTRLNGNARAPRG